LAPSQILSLFVVITLTSDEYQKWPIADIVAILRDHAHVAYPANDLLSADSDLADNGGGRICRYFA